MTALLAPCLLALLLPPLFLMLLASSANDNVCGFHVRWQLPPLPPRTCNAAVSLAVTRRAEAAAACVCVHRERTPRGGSRALAV
jgi:hypothetical protein